MTQTLEDMSVHTDPPREKTVARAFRMPESVLLGLQAVQKRNGDANVNETAVKAIEAYVASKLGKAAQGHTQGHNVESFVISSETMRTKG